MFGALYTHLIHEPLYNALIALVAVIPGGDVGIALILLTILVKSLLFPLAIRASKTQKAIREIEPTLKALREKHKSDPEKLARETMALYRERGVNPFASIGILLIQLPIILGLYFVFARGGLPDLHVESLYAFTPRPETISMLFVGLIDMAAKSPLLALLAGLSQFFQARLALPEPPKPQNPDKPTFGEDFARSMHLQMRYVLPVVVTAVAYFAAAAVALYWVTSNIVSILQEWHIKRSAREQEKTVEAL